jgi:predicted AAA+ superfamily ATPase
MMIARPDYIKMLMRWRDRRVIKILTGVRRCGKSTLMRMYQDELLKSGVPQEQIQSYNLEEKKNKKLRDSDVLYEYIVKRKVPNKQNYVFLDEIQFVPDFGSVANSLYIDTGFDIYITGSNSKTLPIHIANSITREYVTLDIYPLSFKEFYTARREIDRLGISDIFSEYVTYSCLPFVFTYLDGSEFDKNGVEKYLNDLIYKIIYRDSEEEKNITDKSRFDTVLKFLADNISKETSIRNIANTMTSKGLKTNHDTIAGYIEALCDNFLFYRVAGYDIKGKYRIYPNYKYYLVDVGLRRALLGDRSTDRGKILENVVYLELLRRGYKVYVGKFGNKEIDFVTETSDGLEYYQVAENLAGEETFKREYTVLNSIRDHFPKFIITGDYYNSRANGIKVINIAEWLLDRL